nr:PREDICTED: mitochondrial arginine transporter BAC1 isoform X3 [Daucus carota subsp. sativus]
MAFESSLIFGIYSQSKKALQGGNQSDKPQPSVIIPAAAFGGTIISFVLCPSELVKCRMQVQGTDSLVPNSSKYNGPLDCVAKTFKSDGVTGIFRGGFTTLLRESIGNAVFFCTYEHLRYYIHAKLKDSSHDPSNLIDIGVGVVTGGLSGIAVRTLITQHCLEFLYSFSFMTSVIDMLWKAPLFYHYVDFNSPISLIYLPQFWSVVLPLDVAKTVIQTTQCKSSTRNPFSVLKSIHARAGLKGCYAGFGPTVVRAFPANAAAIVSWELAVKLLGIKRD